MRPSINGNKAGTANPQSLNRYSYVNNNPINHTDPSGHWIAPCDCGSNSSQTESVGGAVKAVTQSEGAFGEAAASAEAEALEAETTADAAEAANIQEEGLYKRPSGWRKGVAEKALDEASTNDQNEKIRPTCGNVLQDKITVDTKNGQVEQRGYQLDHYPDTVAERRVVAKREGWTRKQWLDDYNQRVRAQCGPCNVSHEWEGKPGLYGTKIE